MASLEPVRDFLAEPKTFLDLPSHKTWQVYCPLEATYYAASSFSKRY